jgi:alkanesulfonate monooxygenase SsuD/methylene tetrahydromethanopterin reductase-like flavin-dependent oxidoreductase (luciferase family)
MAAVTDRIVLAVDVLNVSLRHPFLLAGQLAVAQAASRGRVEVGLGAGSHHLARFDHAALGRRFPLLAERRRTLARCCELFPRLWAGEALSDGELGLTAASLGALGIVPPPIFVGGTSDETMAVAARLADGWKAVVADADRYANWRHASRNSVARSSASGRSARRCRYSSAMSSSSAPGSSSPSSGLQVPSR